MRMRVVAVMVGLVALSVSRVRANVELSATLDATQETPTPTGVSEDAGGTATFLFTDEDGMLSYTVSVHDLTADPVAGHLHLGQPGAAGPIIVTLPVLPKNDGVAVSASFLLPVDTAEDPLFAGLLYINFHTPTNPMGEIRGQVLANPGTCRCVGASKPGAFTKCVKKAVKQLPKAERSEEVFKQLKKNAGFNTCGSKKTKQPANKVACCLLLPPEENIASGYVCSPKSDTKCANLGGTSLGTGSSCFPATTNPCRFPASPSGAFLDD